MRRISWKSCIVNPNQPEAYVIKVNFAELVIETAQRSCAAMKNSTENELIEVYVIWSEDRLDFWKIQRKLVEICEHFPLYLVQISQES